MNNVASFSNLDLVIASFLKIALGFVGIALLAMLIVSGFQYLSAAGDKEAATKARNTLTFAILGLVISISAWMIINILGRFLGISDIANFSVCLPGGC